MLGIITGLRAEAVLARKFFPDAVIAMSFSTSQGAEEAIAHLKKCGVRKILSFGCAGALNPEMKVGDILMPEIILADGKEIPVSLKAEIYAKDAKVSFSSLIAVREIISTFEAKDSLWRKTGAVAVDMESGAAALSGLPFGVLRVICDEAAQTLPPAALLPLNKQGKPDLYAIFASLLQKPFQIFALLKLGKNAFIAQASLKKFLKEFVL